MLRAVGRVTPAWVFQVGYGTKAGKIIQKWHERKEARQAPAARPSPLVFVLPKPSVTQTWVWLQVISDHMLGRVTFLDFVRPQVWFCEGETRQNGGTNRLEVFRGRLLSIVTLVKRVAGVIQDAPASLEQEQGHEPYYSQKSCNHWLSLPAPWGDHHPVLDVK